MSWRRLAVLIRHLPPGSSVYVLTESPLAWTVQDHLAASMVDVLAAGNWQRGGGKGQRPKPIPRPGKAGRKNTKKMGDRSYTPDELKVVLANWGTDGS